MAEFITTGQDSDPVCAHFAHCGALHLENVNSTRNFYGVRISFCDMLGDSTMRECDMRVPCTWLLLLIAVQPALAQGKTADSIFDKTLRSCVFIVAAASEGSSRVFTGTGSYVGNRSGNPIVVTNYHVIASCLKESGRHNEVIVMFPVKNSRGEVEQNRSRYLQSSKDSAFTFRGRIVAYAKTKDLALIELILEKRSLPKGVTALPLAANSPRPSSRVHTIGNTGVGGMWSYTEGNVRSIYDKQFAVRLGNSEVLQINAKLIESSNPTNKGDSGGPLVNDDGELVGVTQGGVTTANQLSTFIDLSEVKALLQQQKITLPRRSATLAQQPQEKNGDMQANSAEASKNVPEKEKPKINPREAEAASKLRFAQRAFKVKDYGIAEQFLKQIINDYDDTAAVTEARTLLEEVKKVQK